MRHYRALEKILFKAILSPCIPYIPRSALPAGVRVVQSCGRVQNLADRHQGLVVQSMGVGV